MESSAEEEIGPITLPWGTPASTERGEGSVDSSALIVQVKEVRKPNMKVALCAATWSELGKPSRMPTS